jgi:hypothetical protein
MTTSIAEQKRLWPQAFTTALLVNLVWVNASEIARYFLVLRDMMKNTFPQIPEIAPMNFPVFLSWGVWDSILIFVITGFSWLYLERFGDRPRNAVIAGTWVWLAVFGLLWLGLLNLNLASFKIVAAMLPWAWAEQVIAAFIVLKLRRRSNLL